MTKRILIGALLSALAVFLWGYVYWNVLPLRGGVIKPVPDEETLAGQLKDALPESGVYALPEMREGVSPEAWAERYARGPNAVVFFGREGAPPYGGTMFGGGFLHMLVSAFLMGCVLAMALPALRGYGQRLRLVLLAGLAGAFFAHLDDPLWFHQPWGFHSVHFFYDVTCWLLVALILARFVRPAAEA